MTKKKTNLSEHTTLPDGQTFKVGIAVSKWNQEITSALLRGANETLIESGVKEENIKVIEVPGAFELPVAAKMLLQTESFDGIIALGCVIKGETSHNEYINNAVANGLTQLALVSGKPCTFGLLTPNDMQQALDRSGGKHGNKGHEAAATVLEMIALKKTLTEPASKIGY
ncbi:UNVERIFIED_CONTAM: hypothetical protein GTU68_038560 [Idotea baltica]|nr:hypothetical protein [Idotea baltica]